MFNYWTSDLLWVLIPTSFHLFDNRFSVPTISALKNSFIFYSCSVQTRDRRPPWQSNKLPFFIFLVKNWWSGSRPRPNNKEVQKYSLGSRANIFETRASRTYWLFGDTLYLSRIFWSWSYRPWHEREYFLMPCYSKLSKTCQKWMMQHTLHCR